MKKVLLNQNLSQLCKFLFAEEESFLPSASLSVNGRGKDALYRQFARYAEEMTFPY